MPEIVLFGIANAMFTGHFAAQFSGTEIHFAEDIFHFHIPGGFVHLVTQQIDMQIAVTGMTEAAYSQAVLFL